MPYQDWMLKWIKNNNAFRESGNAYARQIFSDNQGILMTVFEGTLTDAQIKNIIAYLANIPKEEEARQGYKIDTIAAQGNDEGNVKLLLLLAIGALLIILYVLHNVPKYLKDRANEKRGIPPVPEFGFWKGTLNWIKTHKISFAVINIFLTVLFLVYGWSYLWGIDVTPGYHPSQPINFLHKVHASEYTIPCIYCHSGAEKGKVAGIPTLNVCMNCHKGIQGSNPEYQKEISKIYYAIGYDVQKGTYTNPQHPVKWNRVHSLPDFVYFNHAQHVSVGKIACQTCHGDCADFTTNQQFAPLTMGWCINCHRNTEVQMAGNGYYARIHAALMKQDSSRKITEADMGGLECGKCHY